MYVPTITCTITAICDKLLCALPGVIVLSGLCFRHICHLKVQLQAVGQVDNESVISLHHEKDAPSIRQLICLLENTPVTCSPTIWHYHWFGLLPLELLPGVTADGRGGGHQEHWAASSAGLWFSSVAFCSVFILAGQTKALRRSPSTLPLLYFYFYQWMMIWGKVILIFCLKRLQLNIHSSWGGLLCSVFGMCVTETKGCAFIFKEIGHHYRELNNLFSLISRVVGKTSFFEWWFFFPPWILKQNKKQFAYSLCNSKLNWDASPRLFCSVRHIQHEFICS